MSMLVNPFYVSPGGAIDPSFANVVCLAHMDGTNGSTTITNVVQALGRGAVMTAHGTAALSTTSPFIGTASLNVTGATTSYVDSGASSDYTLGSTDFTLEFAMKTATPAATMVVFQMNQIVGGLVRFITSGSSFTWAEPSATAGGGTVATSTWQQIAITRNSSVGRFFIDGVQIGSTFTSSTNIDATTFRLGVNFTPSFPFAGNFDEFRLTKGVCRYTGNYTPAVVAFPDS